MGVDINGINPCIKGERPEELNWDVATQYEKDMYFNKMDIFYNNNPGVYFRGNWWGWRPIHAIADMAIKLADLPFDTNYWGSNGGAGLRTQEECDQLADAIELFLALNNSNMHEEDDVFYLCLGSWCTSSGGFISTEQDEKLNQDHPIGTILYQGVVADDGALVFPSHSVPFYRVTNFVTFLRNCGGFEIW
jgi:hypothetical protein